MKATKRTFLVGLAVLVVGLLGILANAQGQSTIFGGIMSYDPANQWVLFTDPTGTWHAPLALTNSAAPKNSVVELTVNTDDQFVIQTYGGGYPDSFLDVDVDGSANLYGGIPGSVGGGVGVEAATSDTCIPSTRPAPCSPTSLRIGSNGLFKSYLGQPTTGNGIAAILYTADATETGSFGPYTIFTTNGSGYGSSGMYRMTGYMTVTEGAPGAQMQFVVTYSDETGAQYQNTGAPILFQSVGQRLPFSFVFYSDAAKPISVAMVTTGNQPTYTVHLRLEAL